MHLNMCCIALSCMTKFHVVANKRFVDEAKSGQDIFFFIHEEKPPLRGAICDIWEATQKLSLRFTDLWHSKSEERREAIVLLEGVHIEKLASMQVPPNYDPVSDRKLGLHLGDMYLTSCISRAVFLGSDLCKLNVSMK